MTTDSKIVDPAGALSDTAPAGAGPADAPEGTGRARPATLLGVDYGIVSVDGPRVFRLLGAPAGKRLTFMWRILVRNALGVAILIDHAQPDPAGCLKAALVALAPELGAVSCVVGVGELGIAGEPALEGLRDLLADQGYVFPVISLDAAADLELLMELLQSQTEARELMQFD